MIKLIWPLGLHLNFEDKYNPYITAHTTKKGVYILCGENQPREPMPRECKVRDMPGRERQKKFTSQCGWTMEGVLATLQFSLQVLPPENFQLGDKDKDETWEQKRKLALACTCSF